MGSLASGAHNLLGHGGVHAAAVIAACGALQCSYDFDRFDPTSAAAQGGGAGIEAPLSDAAAGGPMADESAGTVDSGTTAAIDAPSADVASAEVASADATSADATSASDVSGGTEASTDAGCGAVCIS